MIFVSGRDIDAERPEAYVGAKQLSSASVLQFCLTRSIAFPFKKKSYLTETIFLGNSVMIPE